LTDRSYIANLQLKEVVANMMRRVVMLCVVLGLLWSGAISGLAEQTTLRIIGPWGPEELPEFQPVIDEFERQNPDIRIEYRTGRIEDIAVILLTQFAAGMTPADVIDVSTPWFIVEQARKGHLMELSVPKDAFLSGLLDRVTIEGKVYGVPWSGGFTIIEYRKSFYANHGLPEPRQSQTWDEFVALLNRIRTMEGVKTAIASGNGVGWPFTSVVENFIIAFGGPELHRDLTQGDIKWTSPAVRQVFTKYLLPLLQQGYFGEPEDWEAAVKLMWDGKYGLYFGDSTDAGMLQPSEDWGCAVLPGQKGVVMWNDWWFVPRYTSVPQAAMRFIEFLVTQGQAIAAKAGSVRCPTSTKVPLEVLSPAVKEVYELVADKVVLPDMDDTVGGEFQTTMWDQLKLLWATPTEQTLDTILQELQRAREATLGR